MIVLINTSDRTCTVTLVCDEDRYEYKWQSDMMLARKLLGYIEELLKKHSASWSDIKGIGVYEGPGSFTGIRIGLTVMNTIADTMNVPIVGGRGLDWEKVVLGKLERGENEKIVLPFYDRRANITIPRK